MFYHVDAIEELMPDVLVYNDEPTNLGGFRSSFGNFSNSQPSKDKSSKTNSITQIDKALDTKPVWQTLQNNYRSLPESVLCHPSIGYSFRYGNVMLNGLDNSIEK